MSDQVQLRAVTEEDLPNCIAWLSDPEVVRYTTTAPRVWTMEEELEWFKRVTAPEYCGKQWAIDAAGRHIGSCALNWDEQQQVASFGIMIGDKSAWNKGYGTAALQQVLSYGFAEAGLHRIWLNVFAENKRAIHCYEKCGFRYEGTARQVPKPSGFHDIDRMAILRSEWCALQTTPAGIHIREFRWADFDQMMEVWRAALPPRIHDNATEIAKKMRQGGDLFLVACDGPRVIGTVIGGWDGWRASFWRLAVDPDYQRQGIGRRLLEELEGRLQAKGAFRVFFTYHLTNTTAEAFYRTMGYRSDANVGMMGKELFDYSQEKDDKR